MILGVKSPGGGCQIFRIQGGVSILRGVDFSRGGFRFSEKNSPAAGSYLVIFQKKSPAAGHYPIFT